MVSFKVKENKYNQILNHTKFILVETLESVMLCYVFQTSQQESG